MKSPVVGWAILTWFASSSSSLLEGVHAFGTTSSSSSSNNILRGGRSTPMASVVLGATNSNSNHHQYDNQHDNHNAALPMMMMDDNARQAFQQRMMNMLPPPTMSPSFFHNDHALQQWYQQGQQHNDEHGGGPTSASRTASTGSHRPPRGSSSCSHPDRVHISSFPSSSEAAMVYPSQMMMSTTTSTMSSTSTSSSSPMTAMHQMKVPTGRLRDTTAAPEDATDDTEQPSSPMDTASSSSPPWVYPSQLWSRSSSTSRSTTGSLSPSEEPTTGTKFPRMDHDNDKDDDIQDDNKNPYSVIGTYESSPASMAQMAETWAALNRQGRPPVSSSNSKDSNNHQHKTPPRSQDEINAVKKQTEHDPWKMTTTTTRDHDRDNDTKDTNKDDIRTVQQDPTTPPPQDSTSFTGWTSMEPDLDDLEQQALDYFDLSSSSQLQEPNPLPLFSSPTPVSTQEPPPKEEEQHSLQDLASQWASLHPPSIEVQQPNKQSLADSIPKTTTTDDESNEELAVLASETTTKKEDDSDNSMIPSSQATTTTSVPVVPSSSSSSLNVESILPPSPQEDAVVLPPPRDMKKSTSIRSMTTTTTTSTSTFFWNQAWAQLHPPSVEEMKPNHKVSQEWLHEHEKKQQQQQQLQQQQQQPPPPLSTPRTDPATIQELAQDWTRRNQEVDVETTESSHSDHTTVIRNEALSTVVPQEPTTTMHVQEAAAWDSTKRTTDLQQQASGIEKQTTTADSFASSSEKDTDDSSSDDSGMSQTALALSQAIPAPPPVKPETSNPVTTVSAQDLAQEWTALHRPKEDEADPKGTTTPSSSFDPMASEPSTNNLEEPRTTPPTILDIKAEEETAEDPVVQFVQEFLKTEAVKDTLATEAPTIEEQPPHDLVAATTAETSAPTALPDRTAAFETQPHSNNQDEQDDEVPLDATATVVEGTTVNDDVTSQRPADFYIVSPDSKQQQEEETTMSLSETTVADALGSESFTVVSDSTETIVVENDIVEETDSSFSLETHDESLFAALEKRVQMEDETVESESVTVLSDVTNEVVGEELQMEEMDSSISLAPEEEESLDLESVPDEESRFELDESLFMDHVPKNAAPEDVKESSEIIKALVAAAAAVTVDDESITSRAKLLKVRVLRQENDQMVSPTTPRMTSGTTKEEADQVRVITSDALKAVRNKRQKLKEERERLEQSEFGQLYAEEYTGTFDNLPVPIADKDNADNENGQGMDANMRRNLVYGGLAFVAATAFRGLFGSSSD